MAVVIGSRLHGCMCWKFLDLKLTDDELTVCDLAQYTKAHAHTSCTVEKFAVSQCCHCCFFSNVTGLYNSSTTWRWNEITVWLCFALWQESSWHLVTLLGDKFLFWLESLSLSLLFHILPFCCHSFFYFPLSC